VQEQLVNARATRPFPFPRPQEKEGKGSATPDYSIVQQGNGCHNMTKQLTQSLLAIGNEFHEVAIC
jgi:hypothetical protein